MVEASAVKSAEVVHLPRENGDVLLYGFVVAHAPDVDDRMIQRELAGLLPSYMVPDEIMLMGGFPHTPSGKVDRMVLRDLALQHAADREAGVPAT